MRSAFLCAAMLAACGGQASAPDAGGPDAFTWTPPACEVDFGRTFILDSITIAPEGDGLDLDGDAEVDNALAFLGPVANPVFEDAVFSGTNVYLLGVGDWTDPPTSDDPEVTFALYVGLDADQPPDSSNNFSGEGRFLAYDHQFDVSCRPLSIGPASISAGVLNGSVPSWKFFANYVAAVEMEQMQMVATFDSGFTEFSGLLGAIWTICSLSRTYAPQLGTSSFMGLMANQWLRDADMDVDGDGLETVMGDGVDIAECVDGDGTVITGPECACDPRIVDGYSIGVRSTGVLAEVVGILESY